MSNPRVFLRKTLVGALIVAMTTGLGLPPKGWAMLAPADANESASAGVSDRRAQDLKTVQVALESEVVRRRLADYKMTPEEINSRLSQLSDSQIHQVAMQIDSIHPGGDVGGILVIALLVILIIYLLKRI